MALNLAALAALGVIPQSALSGAQDTQGVMSTGMGQSLFPVGADGTDPLAPLADDSGGDKKTSSKGPLDQPWRSDALLALGAGLLSGHSFFDGLAKGATAAQAARHEWENPKRNLVANGAFTLEQYPDGSTKLVPNKAIQSYESGLTQNALLGKLAMSKLQGDMIADRMAANNKAQMDRTQAIIDQKAASDQAHLEADKDYHTKDLALRAQIAGGKETPFQKGVEQAQGKAFATLPDEINQDEAFSDSLAQLQDIVKRGKIGLGRGTEGKAARGLARVLGNATPGATGIDFNDLTQAEQIINHIKMIATRQWLKGMGGSRLTNYDLKLATTAQPNLDMSKDTFLNTLNAIKKITDIGIEDKKRKLQEGEARLKGGGTASGVTSSGIRWSIAD